MSVDNCTHSFFGASKTYADLVVQEYGKNIGLKTACFRAGCITGPNHAGAELHGFLSYLVKTSLRFKKYNLIGYKGKQVRDNIHSKDLATCFWEYFKKPKKGIVYNTGGGRFSNCSVIEALNLVEATTKMKIKKKIIKQNRVGDHIWYISNMKNLKRLSKLKQIYSSKRIILELIDKFSKYFMKTKQSINWTGNKIRLYLGKIKKLKIKKYLKNKIKIKIEKNLYISVIL